MKPYRLKIEEQFKAWDKFYTGQDKAYTDYFSPKNKDRSDAAYQKMRDGIKKLDDDTVVAVNKLSEEANQSFVDAVGTTYGDQAKQVAQVWASDMAKRC